MRDSINNLPSIIRRSFGLMSAFLTLDSGHRYLSFSTPIPLQNLQQQCQQSHTSHEAEDDDKLSGKLTAQYILLNNHYKVNKVMKSFLGFICVNLTLKRLHPA